ncbi:MAG: DUF1624 domain-containing protein [Bacteroidales bacterium]|nr:DUF1624 domain-containing protein [Lachnoclostridium sp.]MCM1383430.1 DUF1624 domain-containing protein [Lachnoclostridium sp.]MCM1464279.1 DUF1624 domain-containing protein [Bacteroidales bacterium]
METATIKSQTTPASARYGVLDCIRGIALINMILYHAAWDLVYLFGFPWQWYHSDGAYLWQQGICCTFIFLSGFCQPLGRKKIKRGLIVFLAGFLISFATILVMPQNRVVFGVLTLIGSCMLLMALSEHIVQKCRPSIGFAVCTFLFILTRHIGSGYLGIGNLHLLSLPRGWYHDLATTFLGFPMPGFYSTDYFPLFPWLFLFTAGFFLYQICEKKRLLHHLSSSRLKGLEWVGRHSLAIYMVHQPALYLLLTVLLPKH